MGCTEHVNVYRLPTAGLLKATEVDVEISQQGLCQMYSVHTMHLLR